MVSAGGERGNGNHAGHPGPDTELLERARKGKADAFCQLSLTLLTTEEVR